MFGFGGFLRALLVVGCTLAPVASQSAIVSVSGAAQQITLLDIPFNATAGIRRLWPGDLESNQLVRVFDEQQNAVLPVDLSYGLAPPVDPLTWPTSPTSPPLPSGTTVSSYFVHFDPIGTSTALVTLTGSITFDAPIVRVIVGTPGLDATDSNNLSHPVAPIPLGLPDLYYTWGGLRTLESVDQIEVTLTAPRTLAFTLAAGDSIDQIRVLTAAVPEPTPGQAVGIGLLVLAAVVGHRVCRRGGSGSSGEAAPVGKT